MKTFHIFCSLCLLLFGTSACHRMPSDSPLLTRAQGYAMSDSTYSFAPWLAQLIDSFVAQHPNLNYDIFINKIDEDTLQLALQGTVTMRMEEERACYELHPLTVYKSGNVFVNVYSGAEMFLVPRADSLLPEKGDYYPTARREAFCLIYVYDDSLHFFRDWREADIYPFTEHRMNVWQPDDDETTD